MSTSATDADSVLLMISSLSTLPREITLIISNFGQHNRFQCVETVDFGKAFEINSYTYVCISELTGQTFVSVPLLNVIFAYDRKCPAKPQKSIKLQNTSYCFSNQICVDGDELFVADYMKGQIQVFSTIDMNNRRNLPMSGHFGDGGSPVGLGVCNSILIVAVQLSNGGFVGAMTIHGQLLWKTFDKQVMLHGQCNIFVNKVTDEILVYGIYFFFGRTFDLKSGNRKQDFAGWNTRGEIRGFVTINAQNEILVCSRTNKEIEIKIFSRDDKFIESKSIPIPVTTQHYPSPSSFCVGGHGELIIYDCGRLHIIK